MLTLAVFQINSKFAEAQSQSPPSPSIQSNEKSFWEDIDTRFGGRFRGTGRAFRVDEDSFFEPVGTGTYWDGSFNFRLSNETFFTDSVFTDVAYELIGAGGDLVRKTNELEESFPNISTNVFLA
ncbi:MAG: hypothetical protein HKO68_04330, partial [Desulfobacterales bacterium]|nr:hypothetical protein [Desulfobacterales bacterium]